MPTATPATLDQSMTKRAVCDYLGKSPRSVAEYTAKGRLPVRYVNGANGKQAIFDRADVERLKQEMETPVSRAVLPAESNDTGTSQNGQNGSAALAVIRNAPAAVRDFEVLNAMLDAMRPPPAPLVEKTWLTLDEAAGCGLSRQWLLKEAESGESSIAIRDMGKHARGGRWRFLRDDLGKGE